MALSQKIFLVSFLLLAGITLAFSTAFATAALTNHVAGQGGNIGVTGDQEFGSDNAENSEGQTEELPTMRGGC